MLRRKKVYLDAILGDDFLSAFGEQQILIFYVRASRKQANHKPFDIVLTRVPAAFPLA
jgi:hypothetical protein